MRSFIDVRGESGALYRFNLVEGARPRTAVAGAFVYVKKTREGPELIYADQTINLAEGAPERWQQAMKDFGATHMFIRLNVAAAAREAELADLLAANTPPMNAVAPAST